MSFAKDPTTRFSSRVENYQKYRPSYPVEMLEVLRLQCGLTSDWTIADVGSGTGISAEIFLRNGNVVFGVEPNREMREAAESFLAKHGDRFRSVPGTAEATELPAKSIDLIVAAQAFHWFQRGKTREEFVRILKPRGWVLLLWNERRTDTSPFLRAYEDLLLKFATDYKEVNHTQINEQVISSFFGPAGFKKASLYNEQVFDFDGLKGRLLSSSYVPEQGHPNHEPLLNGLKQIFDEHQRNGQVAFEYDSKMFFGHLL